MFSQETTHCYEIENDCLHIQAPLFSVSFTDVREATSEIKDGEGLSESYTEIIAVGKMGTQHYCFWEDLPVIYMPDYSKTSLYTLQGDHWLIKSIHLSAFTDENDTLTVSSQKHLFAGSLPEPLMGEIFFLENWDKETAIVILSETPDYQTTSLRIESGVVSVDNGGNGLVLGFCKIGKCESLCRAYYRHARKPQTLITMSNTWGDCNGFSRVCHDFVLREAEIAKELGLDVMQIDDGWQSGSTADRTRRDSLGRRIFSDDFWALSYEKFPKGIKEISEDLMSGGVKTGLWFAPDSHDNYKLLDRDISILRNAYTHWNCKFFKLDMFWIQSEEEKNQFLKLLKAIYSFGRDVAVQLDVTRNLRLNYLCGRQYGTVFVENRYTKTANYYPHRTLRNLWCISRYIPAAKFQFELLNPDLNTECYHPEDPFAPCHYDMDYLFASVMVSNPLFWMELQFLSDQRKQQLRPIMAVWKRVRDDLSKADIEPIGDMPTGRSFTGFQISVEKRPKYLLLLREVTDQPYTTITAPLQVSESTILATNSEVTLKITDGTIYASFSKPRAYAFVELL